MFLQQNTEESTNIKTNQIQDNEIQESSRAQDILVELPEFDKTYIESSGEYTVEASKWMGSSIGGSDIYLYKNGQPIYKDYYMSRAYFYMDGEWKWSQWIMVKVLNTISIR